MVKKKVVYRVYNASGKFELIQHNYKTKAAANKAAKATQKRVNAMRKKMGRKPLKFKSVKHIRRFY